MSSKGLEVTAQSAFDTSGYPKLRKDDPYIYQVGFGNTFASEALPGVLPEGQNSPQNCKYDLYAEQISGTPFTTPRATNQRTWFYRIMPSVSHGGIVPTKQNPLLVSDFSPSNTSVHVNPAQVAWQPFEIPASEKPDFIQGLRTLAGNGTAVSREGMAYHVYVANKSMQEQAMVNNDGDFLFVPEVGRLDIQTELGRMMVAPGEIAVVQCGLKFKISLPDGTARGSVYEVYGNHFSLPELGPLGANGMANVRDFEHPVASFNMDQSAWSVTYKIGGQLFECKQDHTPFDVVAWHGNYVPYKYALDKFVIAQGVNKDHTDPSVFCVLMVKSKYPGISFMEFGVAQQYHNSTTNTFRPQYFHRNIASEYIVWIKGGPGGHTGYTGFTPHGPTVDQWEEGVTEELVPKLYYEGIMVTVVEPFQMFLLTDFAVKCKEYKVLPNEPWTYRPNFLKHVDAIDAQLKSAGRPGIKESA